MEPSTNYMLVHLPLYENDRVGFVQALNEYAASGWRLVCYLSDGDFIFVMDDFEATDEGE